LLVTFPVTLIVRLVPVSVLVSARPERVPLIVSEVAQAPVTLKVPEKLLLGWVKLPVPERDIELFLDEVYVNCQFPAKLGAA
jgi:hypothetical protein